MGAGASAGVNVEGFDLAELVGKLPEEQKANLADWTYVSHRSLESDRAKTFATAFPECAEPNKVMAIVVEKEGSENRELTAVAAGESAPTLLTASCGISAEDLWPSECVEYAFPESPDNWAMSKVSLNAIESYKAMKFEAWKKMLEEPTCEASLKRMIQIGVVTQLFDPHVFPTPESLKEQYQVQNEKTGETITVPHPVAALRVWNAQKQEYDAVDSHLEGAPPDEEKEAWWATFLAEVETKNADYAC